MMATCGSGTDSYTLSVRCRFPIDLVATEDHQIRLLVVGDPFDKLERSRIGIASSTVVSLGLRIPALPQARAQVQIRNLQYLEPAVLPNPRHRLLDPMRLSPPNAQMHLGHLVRRIQQQRRLLHLPPGSRLHRIRAEEHVSRRDGPVGIAILPAGTPLQPYASGPRFPLLMRFALVAGGRVEPTNPDVHDHPVIGRELFLLLPADVDVCSRQPPGVEVELLVDAVPFFRVELAAGEWVCAGKCCDVGYDETWVMGWEVVVDRGGEDAVAVVEDKDEGEDYYQCHG
jgi:hypothetical protein